jgi:hypothetical protein
MKHFRIIFLYSTLIALSMAFVSMAPIPSVDGDVEFYLQNKCARNVGYSIKVSGKTEEGSLSKGEKKKLCYAPGTEVLVDGEFFMKIAAGDDGETFIVCR